MKRMASQAGMTLMEVMIVVVIVGALMLVALPAYQNQLQKGRRTDAMQALADVASRQESFMLDRQTYSLDMTDLGYADDPYESLEGHYTVDAAFGDCGSIANCYLLTAEPATGSPQEKDTQCINFTLSSTGEKDATGTLGAECW